MNQDQLFERFPCDEAYGLHTEPTIPVGVIASRPGAAIAGSFDFHVRFLGSGGHGGASPDDGVDVNIPCGHFIPALQTIIGRSISSLDSAVISIGHLHAGNVDALNIMLKEATISGTCRYYESAVA